MNAPRTGHPTTADPELETTLLAFANLDYRDRFWPGRRYEDRCDRIALRALLPPNGDRLIEVGAGFGRLADEYHGYREVVLLDSSEAMLNGAREQIGEDSRFTIVSGDAYRLPYPDGSFDAAVCVRVVHHFEDPRPAIGELARVLRPGGVLVLESANKRNLKAILAYVLHRQAGSPFAPESRSYEDVHLVPRPVPGRRLDPSVGGARAVPSKPRWSASTSFAHSPRELRAWLRSAGFRVEATRSVGLFRASFLTGHLPLALLVALERLQQSALGPLTPGPSVVVRAVRRPRSSGPP